MATVNRRTKVIAWFSTFGDSEKEDRCGMVGWWNELELGMVMVNFVISPTMI